MEEVSRFHRLRRVLGREPVRFAVVFLLILAVVFTVNRLVEPTRFMQRYVEMIAKSVVLVLRMSPFEANIVKGSLIRFHTFSMKIVSECSGAEAMAIFCASVIAFPATIKEKLFAVGIGLPALYVVNVLRLVCLGFLGAFVSREVFHFAHVYVWQTIFILFVVCVWLLWIEKVVKRSRAAPVEETGDS